MIVSIHQPNYMPWGGYFYKLLYSDFFIFLDDVQYSKNSFTNRVKLTTKKQDPWLSVPIKYSFGDNINQVKLAQEDWQVRHLSKIKNIYSRTPYFKENWKDCENLFNTFTNTDLNYVNKKIILTIAKWLDICVNYKSSSDIENKKNLKAEDRLIDIIKQCGATKYLSGIGAKKYQNVDKFKLAKIKVMYSDYISIENKILESNKNIQPGTSILDLIFNLGRESTIDYLNRKKI